MISSRSGGWRSSCTCTGGAEKRRGTGTDRGSGDDKKYFEFGLSESEKDKIKQAEEGGAHIYGMTSLYPERVPVKGSESIPGIQGSGRVWRDPCIQSELPGY